MNTRLRQFAGRLPGQPRLSLVRVAAQPVPAHGPAGLGPAEAERIRPDRGPHDPLAGRRCGPTAIVSLNP